MAILWECWIRKKSLNSANSWTIQCLKFLLSLRFCKLSKFTQLEKAIKGKSHFRRSDLIYRKKKTSMWFNNLVFRNHYGETQMLKKFYYRSLLSQCAEIILWFGDRKCYGLLSVLYWIFQIPWRLLSGHVYK